MRITGGELRNKKLTVKSERGLRPTKDMVREAIFGILGDVTDIRVLDLFAGTGALGLESLSRGAAFADFVESNPTVCQSIRENARDPRILEKSDTYCEKAKKFLSHPYHETYDLIFLDPPYKYNPEEELTFLHEYLADEGLLVYLYENPGKEKLDNNYLTLPDTLEAIDSRAYGKTAISFIRKIKKV